MSRQRPPRTRQSGLHELEPEGAGDEEHAEGRHEPDIGSVIQAADSSARPRSPSRREMAAAEAAPDRLCGLLDTNVLLDFYAIHDLKRQSRRVCAFSARFDARRQRAAAAILLFAHFNGQRARALVLGDDRDPRDAHEAALRTDLRSGSFPGRPKRVRATMR